MNQSNRSARSFPHSRISRAYIYYTLFHRELYESKHSRRKARVPFPRPTIDQNPPYRGARRLKIQERAAARFACSPRAHASFARAYVENCMYIARRGFTQPRQKSFEVQVYWRSRYRMFLFRYFRTPWSGSFFYWCVEQSVGVAKVLFLTFCFYGFCDFR